jgi:hypothetical protein
MSKYSSVLRLFAFIVILITLLIECNYNQPKNEDHINKSHQTKLNDSFKSDSNSSLQQNDPVIVDDKLRDKIIDKIANLAEVQEKSIYIDSLTKGKNGISVIILSSPSKTDPYYWVQAGYNSSVRFEPYFNFYVYPPNLEIKYLDVNNEDKLVSLKEWRRMRKRSPYR